MSFLQFGNVELDWLGHASFIVKGEGKVIYFDPYLLPSSPEKADLILITHDHYDHCDHGKVEQIKKPDTVIITTSASARKLSGNIKTVKEGDSITEKEISIKVVPAYNPGKPFHPRGSGVGFIIDVGGTKIYHAGDTDFIPEMSNIQTDIALLPIGGTYTMDENEGVRVALTIKPKIVIPMHHGHISGTDADPKSFKEKVQKENPEIEVKIL